MLRNSRRRRKRQSQEPELDITAFMNLMVILVPFLLITAVFSRITVLDLYLPPDSNDQAMSKNTFQLEVIIRQDSLVVVEKLSRTRKQFPRINQSYDYPALTDLLKAIKEGQPQRTEASILSEPEIEYDTLIQVMDHVRMYEEQGPSGVVMKDLFPAISIGDSPGKNA